MQKKFPPIEDFKKMCTDSGMALRFLFDWKNPASICPICKCKKQFYPVKTKSKCLECGTCGHQIYPAVGTIMEGSKLEIRIWIESILTMAYHKDDLESFAASIRISLPSANRIALTLRYLMHLDLLDLYLKGKKPVESDEHYHGPATKMKKQKNSHWNKTLLLGIIERRKYRKGKRRGKLFMSWLPKLTRANYNKIINQRVSKEKKIFTDKGNGFKGLSAQGFDHRPYSKRGGGYHANSMEVTWKHFKRFVNGIHMWVSHFYMQLYVAEYCFRYNRRKDRDSVFYDLLRLALTTRVEDINLRSAMVPDFRRGKKCFDENCTRKKCCAPPSET